MEPMSDEEREQIREELRDIISRAARLLARLRADSSEPRVNGRTGR